MVMRTVTLPIDLSRTRAGKCGKVWSWERNESGRYVPRPHGFGCPVYIAPLGRCWLAVDGAPADFEEVEDARQFTQLVAKWLRTVPMGVKVTTDANLRYVWVEVPSEMLGEMEVLPSSASALVHADRR